MDKFVMVEWEDASVLDDETAHPGTANTVIVRTYGILLSKEPVVRITSEIIFDSGEVRYRGITAIPCQNVRRILSVPVGKRRRA